MFFKTDFRFLLMLYFRFSPTRWVQNKSVEERADEVWDSVVKVMKHWEGLSQSQRPKNKSYETLVKHYADPLMGANFKFFEDIASVFEPYLSNRSLSFIKQTLPWFLSCMNSLKKSMIDL